MDYREPAAAPAAPAKAPFAVQAAQYAFWAPIVVLVMGCVLNLGQVRGDAPRQMSAYVYLALAVFNGLVALSAVIMGGIALAGIRKHGKARILVRAIAGMVLGLGILSMYFLLPFWLNPSAMISKRLVGVWVGQQQVGPVRVAATLTLREDGTAAVDFQGPGGAVTAPGLWQARAQKGGGKPLLLIRFDDPNGPLGQGIVWTLERVAVDEITLETKHVNGELTQDVFRKR